MAIVVKINHLKTGVVSSGKTEVQLNLTVRGTGGRPVKNAKVSVFDSEQLTLGLTDETGQLSKTELLSSGRSLIIQVEGIAFKMQRTLLVPRSLTYKSSIFFDLAEVHEGNATLISTANTETASLMPLPKQTPEALPLTLTVDTQRVTANQDVKNKFAESANLAAIRIPLAAKSNAICQSLNVPNPVVECELKTSDGNSFSRLLTALPINESEAKMWIENFFDNAPTKFAKNLSKNEVVFVVKHFNQKYRAYFGSKPIEVWKQKKDSHLFRVKVDSNSSLTMPQELLIMTDDGRILQRRIKYPLNKRFITVRIPASERLNLSKR
jgi:hypothetical protein